MIAPANKWPPKRHDNTKLIKLIRQLIPPQSTPREIEDEETVLYTRNRLRECDDVESSQ